MFSYNCSSNSPVWHTSQIQQTSPHQTPSRIGDGQVYPAASNGINEYYQWTAPPPTPPPWNLNSPTPPPSYEQAIQR